MTTPELVAHEVAALPEAFQREVYDFALFLRQRLQDDSFNGLALSESALAKDWNSDEPEVDAGDAWMAGVASEWADDLADTRQDVYTLADGEPVRET